MKNLIRCGICEAEGKINILGEIDPYGDLLVLRFHNGVTRILGESFTVVCEYHKEPIYIKKGGTIGEIFNNWQSRVLRFTYSGTLGEAGTHSFAG